MLEGFCEYLRRQGKSENTVKAYCQGMKEYMRWHEETFGKRMKMFLRANVLDYISYYRALVYLLGMTEETRANFSRCFDGEARMIRPAALGEGWQTGGTARIVRMAFNLWNGWCYESEEDAQEGRMSEAFTPDNLFCCEFAPYFYEAVKLRYPEYTDRPRK